MTSKKKIVSAFAMLIVVISIILLARSLQHGPIPSEKTVPHEERCGIYALDLITEEVELMRSSYRKVSYLRLNSAGDRFVFSQKIDGDTDEYEVCMIGVDGSKVVFERLLGDDMPPGNYDVYVVNVDDSRETRLANNGYFQGLAVWSHSGDKIGYVVSAIGGEGKYDIYMMNSDGTDIRDITPSYFTDSFLYHAAILSLDDSKIFFVGEWWE